MKKTKFKVGDRVIANKDTPYSITTVGWKGKVIGVADGKILVGASGLLNDYWVESKYFDLYTERRGSPKGKKNKPKCDCYKHYNQVCDICMNVTGNNGARPQTILRCPKSITGSHSWVNGSRSYWVKDKYTYLPVCDFCDLKDDREDKVTPDKVDKDNLIQKIKDHILKHEELPTMNPDPKRQDHYFYVKSAKLTKFLDSLEK